MRRQLYTRKKEEAKKNIKREEQITSIFKVNHSIELLEFLLSKCKTSRNNIKNLLSQHKVLVNGSVVSQFNFNLVKDDEVKILKNSSKEITANKENRHIIYKLPFEIIYEDEDFIAINKPSGLLSVESDNERICAFSHLLKYFQSKSKTSRPYILHRIDKETSGVLVFAKNPKIHSMLRLNWNDLVRTREYFAVVSGKVDKVEGNIVSYLKENKNNIVYSSFDKTGQKAITHYELIEQNEKFSLLKVLIDTGRKNQIRVHLKDIGYPIVNDEKYGFIDSPLKRLGLHSSKLVFIHPITKKEIIITAKVPEIFYKVVK